MNLFLLCLCSTFVKNDISHCQYVSVSCISMIVSMLLFLEAIVICCIVLTHVDIGVRHFGVVNAL